MTVVERHAHRGRAFPERLWGARRPLGATSRLWAAGHGTGCAAARRAFTARSRPRDDGHIHHAYTTRYSVAVPRSKLHPVQHPNGITFYFAWDRQDASRLHIEIRGSSIEEAISTYLAATLTIRDAEHRRWQSYSATHGVYWTLYGERPGHIIILSRFKLGED